MPVFPALSTQIDRLVELGVPARAGLSEADFRGLAADIDPTIFDDGAALVVLSPTLVPAAAVADLLTLNGKPGFVVVDMTDLHEFVNIPGLVRPETPLYVLTGIDRGDDMANWSPDEALPEILGRERTPLTVHEGISWLLQRPEDLEPNKCFMTIGSRKRKDEAGKKLDSRTPALWISGGTGRDGKAAKGAPKVGWCWAGNRHTWLGFASAASALT